jgi:ATP-dependent Lhr-like helicase
VLSREELIRIKKSLKFTWEGFFSQFGRFTPIQEKAIPVVMSGKDCLLASRTASGKTEAVIAPLIERLKNERWAGLSIVYISPTRALVNDLFRRLEPRLADLGVSVRPRTGDSPYLDTANPPSVLVSTPESFDGLLSRTPRLFINTKAVVLDEIHLLDGSARGDQVRLLLRRLRSVILAAVDKGDTDTAQLQTIALSATVSDPDGAASRYCLNPVVVKSEGKRTIDAEFVAMRSVIDLQDAITKFQKRGIRKALVFCASRAACEDLAAAIRREPRLKRDFVGNPFGDNVFVHHASLDRKVRLDAEHRFSQGQVGICFATSTLELGIDIGDIDAVILIGPPDSISSFLQRIGRGNRRTNKTTLLGFYRSQREYHLFNLLLKAAEDGEQDDVFYSFRPSVIVQQILSYLKQRPSGTLNSKSLRVLLDDSRTSAGLLDASEEKALVDHLVSEDLLAETARRRELTQGKLARAIFERHLENSNISSGGGGVMVVDDLTGRVIGEIQENNFRERDAFALGANILDVARVDGHIVSVNIDNQKQATRSLRFSSNARSLPYHLARKLGDIVGIRGDEMPAFELSDRWYVIHAIGEPFGRMLAYFLSQEFGWKSRSRSLALESKHRPPEPVIHAGQGQIADLVRRKFEVFESGLQMGRFQSYLPTSIRAHSVESLFNPKRFCEAVNGRKIVLVTEQTRIAQLCEIL